MLNVGAFWFSILPIYCSALLTTSLLNVSPINGSTGTPNVEISFNFSLVAATVSRKVGSMQHQSFNSVCDNMFYSDKMFLKVFLIIVLIRY